MQRILNCVRIIIGCNQDSVTGSKSIMLQSVKVREGYVKGYVKAIFKVFKIPASVKVREGYVKGYVKL